LVLAWNPLTLEFLMLQQTFARGVRADLFSLGRASMLRACVGAACLMIGLGAVASPAATAQPTGASGLPVSDFVPLKLGDDAPRLAVAEWIKGTPIAGFEKGTVYVVEFWATWCPPCRESIPHLTELQKKYGDKVRVIGVAIWEEIDPIQKGDKNAPASYVQRVKDFVASQGDTMDYRVAYDGDEGKGEMARTYVKAASRPGIPAAFIVDQNGKVAWIGHPLIRMEEPLEKIVAGTWDLKAEAERERLAQESELRVRTLKKRFQVASRENNAAAAIEAAQGLLDLDTNKHSGFAVSAVRVAAVQAKEPRLALDFAERLLAGQIKDDFEALNAMSWMLLDDKEFQGLDPSIPGLALRLARRASDVTKAGNGPIEDTLARALFETGDTAGAVEAQSRAVALATDPREKAEYQKKLDVYKGAAKK
jgi:thiol-disulfide isomerase/thioredoxin